MGLDGGVMCLGFTTFRGTDVLMQEGAKGLFEYHRLLTLYMDIYIYIV